jgi:hypothetical protein
MKYFFDTEFIEDGKTIDLISIGIVAEDGREFYGINWNCKFELADDWVKENVIASLPFQPLDYPKNNNRYNWYTKSHLTYSVAEFFGCEYSGSSYKLKINEEIPEIWADFCSYDWVALCQLFGKMIDLPKRFPYYCNDIQQLIRTNNKQINLPDQKIGIHNALDDARYVKQLYECITNG